MRIAVPCLLALSLCLTGCSLTSTAPPVSSAAAIHGSAHGGQQALNKAHVYLYAANTHGYGGASISLLTSGTAMDGNGNYYVETAADGSFDITGDYTCTAGKQVYLYVAGGDPGNGSSNPAVGLMAVLGNCPGGNFAEAVPFVEINEISTIAAAYAMAGFATDSTHVANNESNLGNLTAPQAHTGMVNAFANAANIVDIGSGTPLAVTPPVGGISAGTVPAAEIITLANILAACINTNGALTTTTGSVTSPAPCGILFSAATTTGDNTGTAPTETATAAINIAHNPGTPAVLSLYSLPTANQPYEPGLTSAPNDFTIAINFTQGFASPAALAIDASGDAWVADLIKGVVQLSPAGSALATYNGSGLGGATGIAIDQTGNVWAGSNGSSAIVEISSGGTYLSGAAGYVSPNFQYPTGIAIDSIGNAYIASSSEVSPAGFLTEIASGVPVVTSGSGINGPVGVAIDPSGNIWVTSAGDDDGTVNNVSVFSAAGVPLAGTPYTSGDLSVPIGIAIDHSGNAWAANAGNGSVTELLNPGASLTYANFNGGGLLTGTYAVGAAIDGLGDVFATNASNTLSELSNAGTAISPSIGYTASNISSPQGIAIDASGDVWIANTGSASVTEFIGVGAPIVTPIAQALTEGKLAQRP
jgi:streptogramin lyase